MKFPGNFHLSLQFSKNNNDNYLVFRGRNMPPYKSYVILTQILFVTTLVKRGRGNHPRDCIDGLQKKKL